MSWSWIGYLNFFFLQWFCFRLARVTNIVEIHGEIFFEHVGFTTIRWVVPMTGWWTRYRWIKRSSP